MKRLLIAILLMCAAASVGAQQTKWTKIASAKDLGTDFDLYADLETLRVNGNVVTMAILNDHTRAQRGQDGREYLSARSRTEYVCNGNSNRLLNLTLFSGQMGSGRVVYFSGDVKIDLPPNPAAGSAEHAAKRLACRK